MRRSRRSFASVARHAHSRSAGSLPPCATGRATCAPPDARAAHRRESATLIRGGSPKPRRGPGLRATIGHTAIPHSRPPAVLGVATQAAELVRGHTLAEGFWYVRPLVGPPQRYCRGPGWRSKMSGILAFEPSWV